MVIHEPDGLALAWYRDAVPDSVLISCRSQSGLGSLLGLWLFENNMHRGQLLYRGGLPWNMSSNMHRSCTIHLRRCWISIMSPVQTNRTAAYIYKLYLQWLFDLFHGSQNIVSTLCYLIFFSPNCIFLWFSELHASFQVCINTVLMNFWLLNEYSRIPWILQVMCYIDL